MPTAQRTRTIAASTRELWEVLGDPHHLPRWWPRVQRVEAVEADAFTEVLMSGKGKLVRADFELLDSVEGQRVVWAQRIANTPFACVLKSAETEISLAQTPTGVGVASDVRSGAHVASEVSSDAGAVSSDAGAATEVTIELRQTLHGFLARLGSHLVRRAAGSTIEEALDGLERIVGR